MGGQLQETNTRLLAGLQRLKVHYSGQQKKKVEEKLNLEKSEKDNDKNHHDKVNLNEAEIKAQEEAEKKVTRNRVLRSSHQRSANSHYRRPADMEESDDSFAHNSGSPGLGVKNSLNSSPSKNSKRSIL